MIPFLLFLLTEKSSYQYADFNAVSDMSGDIDSILIHSDRWIVTSNNIQTFILYTTVRFCLDVILHPIKNTTIEINLQEGVSSFRGINFTIESLTVKPKSSPIKLTLVFNGNYSFKTIFPPFIMNDFTSNFLLKTKGKTLPKNLLQFPNYQ